MADYKIQYLLDEIFIYSIFENISDDVSKVSEFIALIEQCGMPNCDVIRTEDFYNHQFLGAVAAEFFYSTEAQTGQNRDEFLQFNILLNNISKFNPADYFNDDPHLTTDFQYYIVGNLNVGLLTGFDYSECTWWDLHSIKAVNKDYSPIHYYRFYINKINVSEDGFWEASSVMFPNLYFNKSKLKFSNLGYPTQTVLEWVITTFSYLNDHAITDYLSHSDEFIARAASYNVELSPESPNTHKAKDKMKLRNIEIKDIEVCCEWHAKFNYDKGRIHFHFGQGLPVDINVITRSKLIIGIFCEHLDT